MNYNLRTVLLFLIFAGVSRLSAVDLHVVYPREGAVLQAAPSDSAFIFGHVSPSGAVLTINGAQVPLYDNGSFLAYLPIESGEFTFNCTAVAGGDTAVVQRNVQIPPLYETAGDSLVIEDQLMLPNAEVHIHQDDLLRVQFKGTPNCKAFFTIDGVREMIPMAEVQFPLYPYWGEHVFGDKEAYWGKKIKGVYQGSYLVQPLDWRENRKIFFYLISPQGDTLVKENPHPVTIFDNSFPQTAQVAVPMATLRTGVGAGYYYFLPRNTKLTIDGRYGNFLKVRLARNEVTWVNKSDVRLLDTGLHPPQVLLNVIRVRDIGDRVRIKMPLCERIPFRIIQRSNPQQLVIRLYGVISDTDWIKYESGQEIVRDMRWEQVAENVYQLTILLNQKQQWGYDTYYDENDSFYLEINKSPEIAGWPSSPLKGISLLLDPGHLPDTGAVGPTGTTEAEVNYRLALVLEEKLRSKGALVYMTRRGEHGITLGARKRLAEMFGADILLSLHHNALPDGVNPFRNRGTSTYYYHPQSFLLAELIQEKLLEKLDLNNFGLYYDNLAMCRPTQMPAVLIEPAFLMHPEEEMLIKSDSYGEKCADAIVEALEIFLKKSKE